MSADPTTRQWLETQLTPLIPVGWTINPSMGMPETLSKITLAIKHTGISRLPEAPLRKYDNEVLITIVDPHDIATVRAEELLDDQVLELLYALDQVAGLKWTAAKKVSVHEKYLGWDITLSIITSKKEAPSG